MLETLRSIDHRRYLFGIKRSTEANSWSWQKVFPFWKPKVWRKAVKHFMCPWDFTDWGNRKERDGCFYVPFLSFFFPFFPSFFFFLFISFSFPPSFFRSCHHRSTIHDTSNHRLTCALPHRTTGTCTSSEPYRTVWLQVTCLHSTPRGLILSLTVCAIDLWP